MIDKNRLKKQFRENPPPMGVYQIQNLANGKIFIGSSRNLPGKINSHRFQLKMGTHFNRLLQSEFNLFGLKNFSFTILDYLEPKENPDYDYSADLMILEEMWKERIQPYGERGYHQKKKEVTG